MRTRLISIFVLLTGIGSGAFEAGSVFESDGGAFYTNAYPVVDRLASGKLLTVWTVFAKDNLDARIVGALSSNGGRTWSTPRTLIDIAGMLDADASLVVDGPRIFVYSTTVPMKMTRIEGSRIYMTRSEDEGATWSAPVEIPTRFRYFEGKRHIGLKLLDGMLAMPFAWDLWAERGTPARTEGEMNIASGILLSRDGVHWRPFGALHIWAPKATPYSTNGLDEPALVQLDSGELFMLMRTGTQFLYQSRSRDGGLTWDPPTRSPLTGHNTPAALWRLDQQPGEIVAIWNNSPLNRYPLSIAISADGGRRWTRPRDVATSNGPQISYPGITQAGDGEIVAVWQQQLPAGGRNVRWARFTREWVLGEDK